MIANPPQNGPLLSMTFWKLVTRSLSHYKTLNLMVLLGIALTSAILSGALVVGDSVKESLARNAEARLSKVDSVLIGGERFFTAALADRVGDGVAPILQVEGTATIRERTMVANQVQILGVDDRFWALSDSGQTPPELSGNDWLAVNDILANRLNLKRQQTLVCRVEIPGELSKDAPLSGESEQTLPFTTPISAILGADQLGRYSLRAEQVPRATVFLPISRLQEILDKPDQANLILAPRQASADFRQKVSQQWQLADGALFIKNKHPDLTLIDSPRIFIDPATAELAQQKAPKADATLTYLANKISCGDRLTPYSMVTGTTANLPSPIAADLTDDQIILSQWLADDLGAQPGEQISLHYYIVETGRKLVEQRATFTVHSIGNIGENGWDQSWTPEFPGIFEVDDLDDWEPGIPIDRELIRDKDEDYWDQHRATPKAFITLAAARQMFANRFGNTTSIRLPAIAIDDYTADLKSDLSLGDIGLSIREVADEANQAVSQSFDFGALFASMSFFLILAALVLTSLVFIFGIEARANQIGLLLASGLRASTIRNLFLAEAAVLAVIGALLGLLGGWLYTLLALQGMTGAWQSAASGIDLVYHVKPTTLAIAFTTTVLLALLTVSIASRTVSKIKPSQLISGRSTSHLAKHKPILKTISFWCTIISLLAAAGCLLAPKVEGTIAEQGLFFGAGFLLTIAGVCLSALWFRHLEQASIQLTSLASLGRQNTVRNRGRSLAVVGLMASGVFMVTAVNSFRLEAERGAARRDSGTGGFAYVGESTLPIYEDLNDPAGRKKYGLDSFDEQAYTIVPFRVSDGEDASCLNLNRAQRPRLLGVDPQLLTKLNPFKFTNSVASDNDIDWAILNWQPDQIDTIPAVVDTNTASYALQAKLGEQIPYTNASDTPFHVTISSLLDTSILQGSLIISEQHFIHHHPDAGGYQFFLLDCNDSELAAKIAQRLTFMFGDRGLEMRPTADRLNEFNAVQNTYLSIFSTLGGLGILLGTVGLALVVARNIMDRKGQLGAMQAIGFTRQSLAQLVLHEHWFLHVAGVAIGITAALVAVSPKIIDRASSLPWGLLIAVNLSILICGLWLCAIAARLALRGQLIEALRSE